MRYCHDCVHYCLCEKQNTAIPVQVIEQHKDDVIHLLCRDFKDRQVHGRWLNKDKPLAISMECSVCHACYVVASHNFCPNCGSKMDLPQITKHREE